MTINERILLIRKEVLKLSQRKFAAQLGVSQTSVSYIEQIGNPVQDSTIKLICATFGLSEEWLRTGEGDMYADKASEEKIEEYLKTRGLSPASIRLVIGFINMPPELREGLTDILKALSKWRPKNDYK